MPGDADKCGNVAVEVQPGVHLDGGLAPAKIGRPEQFWWHYFARRVPQAHI